MHLLRQSNQKVLWEYYTPCKELTDTSKVPLKYSLLPCLLASFMGCMQLRHDNETTLF
jgi:hypothetical protein